MQTEATQQRFRTALGILALGMTLATPAALIADDDEDYGSTYGRVRHAEGRLTIQSDREGTVTEAVVNSPVVPGDRIETIDGRAEIELADGTIVWLDAATRLELRTLADADNRYERTNLLALEAGSIRIDAVEPASSQGALRVDTPAGSAYLLSAGTFRIDSDSAGTTVASFRGVAELSGDGGSVLVRSGERSSVRARGSPLEPRTFNTLRPDAFDRFCDERVSAYLRRDAGPREAVEVPREIHPYVRELSFYGGWHRAPQYGWVWRPTYYGAWSPYVNGYWSWYPTGWIWVSHDPWGWAPYRYGRWDFAADLGWIWIPGRTWRGAWVSFAVGPSYIGWCPLNYYNRPVFHGAGLVNVVNINVTRLDARGWRFVPVNRFRDPRGTRVSVRADRLPRDTEVVLSGRLPRFEPQVVAARPDRGRQFVETVRRQRTPVAPAAGDRSFRAAEDERARRAPAPTARGSRTQARDATRPGAIAARPSRETPAPGSQPQGRRAAPQAQPSPRAPRSEARPEIRSSPRREPAPRAAPRRETPDRAPRGQDSGGRGAAATRTDPQRLVDASAPGRAAPAPPRLSERAPRGRDRIVDRMVDGVRSPQPRAERSAPPGRAPQASREQPRVSRESRPAARESRPAARESRPAPRESQPAPRREKQEPKKPH